MNEQLKALIEQYERENPGKKAETVYYNTAGEGFNKWDDGFVLWLASRPTCGQEQRLFLDEVEMLVSSSSDTFAILEKRFNSDIEKVIKGK